MIKRPLANTYVKRTLISQYAIFTLFNKSLFDIDKDVLFVCVYIHPYDSPRYHTKSTQHGISMLQD